MTDIRHTILEELANHEISIEAAKMIIMSLKQIDSIFNDEVVVIGMDCRYAKANNVEEFWKNIREGRNCIDKPSNDRLRNVKESFKRYYHKELKENMIKMGGYLSQIDQFDARFFSIREKEACYMDPWQRILLETSYHAIEDAGITIEELYDSDTGVFIGRDNYVESSYGKMIPDNNPFALSGSYAAVLASRISHFFNLTGPNMVIDTACSSSMSALNRAYMSLISGECHIAIVGGINILENVFHISDDPMKRILSKENEVRSFDKDAKGTILGEGVGVLVLRRKNEAVEKCNHIYALIKGISTNCDGGMKNISSPNAITEERVILNVWKKAEINPEDIRYIEAHGTGTLLGDSIEFQAISEAFKKFTNKTGFCALGAVKPIIGHSVAASGMASVIKAILCMNHDLLPKNINFSNPNPYLDLDNSAIYINDCTREWVEKEKLCGVNSFGYSGVNVHVLLESMKGEEIKITKHKFNLFVLSAKSKHSLLRMVDRYLDFLQEDIDVNYLCNNLVKGRNHFEQRLAIVIKTRKELRDKLLLVKMNQEHLDKLDNKHVYYNQIVQSSRKIVNSKIHSDQRNENLKQIDGVQHILEYEELLLSLAKDYVSGKDREEESFRGG